MTESPDVVELPVSLVADLIAYLANHRDEQAAALQERMIAPLGLNSAERVTPRVEAVS